MAITSDKQRQALEAKGWRMTSEVVYGERWSFQQRFGELANVVAWSDGTIRASDVDRHRLAEFLSIINAKDETVVVEGVVSAINDPAFKDAIVNGVDIVAELAKIDGKRVRVTIEEVAE